jgi:hypothetical protein
MPWAKFDDGFYDHPKVRALLELPRGGEAGFLFVLAVTWSAHALTDGEVSERQMARLWGDGAGPLVALLIKVGFLERAGTRLTIHDFAVYNRTKVQVLADRAQREAAARLGGDVRKEQAAQPGGRGPDGRLRPAAQPAVSPADGPADEPADPAGEQPADEPADMPSSVSRLPVDPLPENPSPTRAPGARVWAYLNEHGRRVYPNGHRQLLLEAVERAGEDRVLAILERTFERTGRIASVRLAALEVNRVLDAAEMAPLKMNGHDPEAPPPAPAPVAAPTPESLAAMIVANAGRDYVGQAGDVPGLVEAFVDEVGLGAAAETLKRATIARGYGATPRGYLETARADAAGAADARWDKP